MTIPRIMRNERGYRIGESHHHARIPDAMVNLLRDLHEGPLRLGPVRLHEMFPEVPRKTIDKIIYYQRRTLTRMTPTPGPSDEQRGTDT